MEKLEQLEKLETMVAPSALTGVGRLGYGFGRRLRRRMVLGTQIQAPHLGYYAWILCVVGCNRSVRGGGAPINGVEPRSIWRPQGDSNPRYRRERAMS